MVDAAEELHLGIDHFDARGTHLVDFGFAVKDQELALLETVFEIAAVKKLAGKLAGGILHEKMIDGIASAHGAHGLAAHYASANGVNAVGFDVLDVGEVDAVFVAKRQVMKEIVDRVDAAFGEEFGTLWADAFDHADFGGQRDGHRCVIYIIWRKGAVKSWGYPTPRVFCVNAVDKGVSGGIGVNAVDKRVSS